MGKTRSKGEGRGLLPGVAMGAMVTLAVSAVIVCLVSALVVNGAVARETGEKLVVAAACLGGVAGGLMARFKNGRAALLSGALSGLMAAAVRFVVSLFAENEALLDSTDITVMICFILGGTGAGLLALKRRRRNGRR